MRNNWNWNWDWNVGPRGPMRGYRRMRRGLGLGWLFALPALLFGGWMIVAVVGALFGAAIMILGGIFSGIGYLAEGIFSGIGTAGSIAIGIIIGLALFSRMKKRNSHAASQEEEKSTVDNIEVETQVVEPEQVQYHQMYH